MVFSIKSAIFAKIKNYGNEFRKPFTNRNPGEVLGQMGGSSPSMDGLSPQSGRPPGFQHGSTFHKGSPVTHGYISRSDCNYLQPFLCIHGSSRRLGGRPFQPQMGGYHLYIVLECCHNVYRTRQWSLSPCDDEERSYRRR